MKQGTLIRITLIAATGGFRFGFDTEVISGTTSLLESVIGLTQWRLGFAIAANTPSIAGGTPSPLSL